MCYGYWGSPYDEHTIPGLGTGDIGPGTDGEPGGRMVIELMVFATMFTLVVLLTGGPSNRL